MTDGVLHVSPRDPRAAPLIADLIREYGRRYGTPCKTAGARDEGLPYPTEAFVAPRGAFLLLLRGGETVGGGAFLCHADDNTAEFILIWTRRDLRRQGLARRLVLALEQRAAQLGYTRIYLTTGLRQREARDLYLRLGYRPLFDTQLPPELYPTLPFEKYIGTRAGRPETAPLQEPTAPAEAAAIAVAQARHTSGASAQR